MHVMATGMNTATHLPKNCELLIVVYFTRLIFLVILRF